MNKKVDIRLGIHLNDGKFINYYRLGNFSDYKDLRSTTDVLFFTKKKYINIFGVNETYRTWLILH